jgi:hypothetical protein
MRVLRPATTADVDRVRVAVLRLREAHRLLSDASAGKAAAAVRGAIKSAEGASRHVERRAQQATSCCDCEAPDASK